ncbi:hypothetical protein BD410DRAFT_122679 [Rickenella mellea]|uniref:Uncharacterized protein n=1 Tax=Rickenella mellea TaxID=50990 RepID=A0A4Y7PIX4_9AGAM|nr:hypothetical protein BD410DRAFT_122679 [Rickenella mellea]
MFSKCLVALLCLNAFAVSTTPAPQAGSQSLTSGLFAIVPTLGGPSLTSFNVTDGSPVGTILQAKTALNQSWSFIATNSPNVFLIMNTASSLFLSFSNAPINGPVQFSQAATHKTPLPFLLQPIPGSKSFNIQVNNSPFLLSAWPSPVNSTANPVTFETVAAGDCPLVGGQNWTLIPFNMPLAWNTKAIFSVPLSNQTM